MTDKQRNFFFSALWPAACRAQRWSGVTLREVKRREVTLLATTELKQQVPRAAAPTDRMSLCDQDQLTAVFNYVKWLGDPANLGKTRKVANPAEAHAEDERGRVVWKIREAVGGFITGHKAEARAEAYVQEIAAWDCREAQVAAWDRLPLESLKRVLIHVNKRRLDKGAPLADPDAPREYQMRPARKFVSRAHLNQQARKLERQTAEAMRSTDDDNCPY